MNARRSARRILGSLLAGAGVAASLAVLGATDAWASANHSALLAPARLAAHTCLPLDLTVGQRVSVLGGIGRVTEAPEPYQSYPGAAVYVRVPTDRGTVFVRPEDCARVVQ